MIKWRRRNIYWTRCRPRENAWNSVEIIMAFLIVAEWVGFFSDLCFCVSRFFFLPQMLQSLYDMDDVSRGKNRQKTKAGKKIDEYWYILLYKTIMRTMQCCLNGEHAKRFGNRREDNKKRKKNEEKLKAFYLHNRLFVFFFFFNGYPCYFYMHVFFDPFHCIGASLLAATFVLCVCVFFFCCSARFFWISVGLLLKKQINLAAPNFFFFL